MRARRATIRRMTFRALLSLGLVTLLVAAGADSALADGLQFGAPLLLPHGTPNKPDYLSGGEPSIAFDPNGDGHLYVTAPQFIPTGVNHACNQIIECSPTNSPTGIGYWASDDHGASWPRSGNTGTANGGGDSDVVVLPDHSVLAADLTAADTAICISSDFAKSFDNCSNGLTTNQQGPENDREWLSPAGGKTVYLTYHDFTAGFPIIERSDDGGRTFSPCGTVIDPGGPAAKNYTPQGGTLVSKPVIGKDGSVYVEFTTPDQNASPVGAPPAHPYTATARGGCQNGGVCKNVLIYETPTADLAKIFQQTTIDGAGNLYVLAAGKVDDKETDTGVWLFKSTDRGEHWTREKVSPPQLKAGVFPTVAGGQGDGELLLGWLGTADNADPNNQTSQWRYYSAATYDGGATFNYTTLTPDVAHYGDVCTQGILCGLIPGQPSDRNLADFASAAVDPSNGCGAFAFPSDPYNRPDLPDGANNFSSSTYVALQDGTNACFTPANAGRAAGAFSATSSSGAGASPGEAPSAPDAGAGVPTFSNGILGGCADRVAPVSRATHARVRHRRVTLSGRS